MSFKTPEGEAIFKEAYDKNLKLWKVPYETSYIPTSYGLTHIVAAGGKELPPLILLHGAGMGSTMWYKNIEPLSQKFRVYALDVMGDMNLSDPSKSFHKGEDIAEWICEVLDALGIEKTSVIGHSAGGYCTLNFVIHAQHRVNRMVLLAPAASFIPFHKQFFFKLLMINLIRNESFISRYFWNWFVSKENRYILKEFSVSQFFNGIRHYKWKVKPVIPAVIPEEKLKTIQVPSLLLMGEDEVIYNPHKAVKRAKQIIPHMEQQMISNASHCLFMEQPELVNRYMIEFLTR
jgi:pimeloyl-ACP methyl ester carboxylesterase